MSIEHTCKHIRPGMTAEEHGCDAMAPGPEGWGKCVHWHRKDDGRMFSGTDDEYADEHFTAARWLSLDFGFAVEEVHYGAEGDHWCYTVGLARFGHPELILQGLPYEVACVILSGLAWQVVLGKERFVSSDSPIALGGAEVRLHKDESEEAKDDHKFVPLANIRNGAPVDWLHVTVGCVIPMGDGAQP